MTINYLILLLPLVCTGLEHYGITIRIELAPNEADVIFEPSGEDVRIANDGDLAAFDLTTDKLDYAVTKFTGEKPTNIYTRSPTPWGDLYKRFNWEDVRREFLIEDLRLVNVTIEKKIVGEREYRNIYNDTEIELKGMIRRFSYNDFVSEHSWSGNDKVPAGVNYLFLRPYLPYPLEYGTVSKVGQTRSESGIQVVGYSDVEATFKLQPGQKAKMYLEATTVVTRLSVQYETVLEGEVVVNYEYKHKGHHFWAHRVNAVLDAAKMAKRLVSKEFVEIRNIKDFKTKVVDATTGVGIKFKDRN